MAFDFQVTIDSSAPHELADWWAEALGWQVEKQDEAFIRRMVDPGRVRGGHDRAPRGPGVEGGRGAQVARTRPAAGAVPGGAGGEDGQEPRAPRRARGRRRREAEVARLSCAGATELWRGPQGPYEWVTLADPEGNEFCVT